MNTTFTCTCGWKWVLDFPHGQVIGPFYASRMGNDEIVLSRPKIMKMEEFAGYYSDCLDDIERKLFT